MQWNDATGNLLFARALQYDVTAALANLNEPQSFQSADHFCP
jgi:hypothetical protein